MTAPEQHNFGQREAVRASLLLADATAERHGTYGKRTQPILMRLVPSDSPRFWEKVAKTDGCWLWTSGLSPKGYGKFAVAGIPRLAHRVAYELVVGPIAAGYELHHRCEVPACVNPAHLQPVTPLEHARLGPRAQQTECKRGHVFDDSTTIRKPNGTRECRPCRAILNARRYRPDATDAELEAIIALRPKPVPEPAEPDEAAA